MYIYKDDLARTNRQGDRGQLFSSSTVTSIYRVGTDGQILWAVNINAPHLTGKNEKFHDP
ncbi:uncharacterized protein PHALS_10395 [Plasmopara halstedii]|uniref:Uncharacterized protein n=1 Tax=Plasmopara halstedii TaxID=4781 RepID=A0A0P1AH09_PLAHL|nr:uncharacterized protein PHALS_10395 [Plasmopara halstedii]CEG40183.1 hypothetical protein PHALS_10395 [Plasmopara halstedii]|eukprot:XP_024576552.1 hypothetical protein PHALS_10395 [Plasmopara halstedii]